MVECILVRTFEAIRFIRWLQRHINGLTSQVPMSTSSNPSNKLNSSPCALVDFEQEQLQDQTPPAQANLDDCLRHRLHTTHWIIAYQTKRTLLTSFRKLTWSNASRFYTIIESESVAAQTGQVHGCADLEWDQGEGQAKRGKSQNPSRASQIDTTWNWSIAARVPYYSYKQ